MKTTVWFAVVFAILIVAFHFFISYRAKSIIEDTVRNQSKGLLALNIGNFKYEWFGRKIELRRMSIYTTDTATATNAYYFGADTIRIELKNLLPIILNNTLVIDSIHIISPRFNATRLRKGTGTDDKKTDDFSIPQEIGRVYNSIQDALTVLKVARFQIRNGQFIAVNKTRADQQPVTFSNIFFQLDNLDVSADNKKQKEKLLFSDNVILRTSNQWITLPNGRHEFGFKNFQIINQTVTFDSCAIVASKTDSANNSFTVFFDKLNLVNIDYASFYKQELIKADSVYCINPKFQLTAVLKKKEEKKKGVDIQNIEKMLQQSVGNMEFKYVAVEDGAFVVNTYRDNQPSEFLSEHNSFHMQNLKLDANAKPPFSVEEFVMAVRNFENSWKDSAYSISFDSVMIRNQRINLSNFSFTQRKNGKVSTLKMPQFELYGLEWNDLILNQDFRARRATLYRPVINYYASTGLKKRKSVNIYDMLADIGEILGLDTLNMVNGDANINLGKGNDISLSNATFNINARQLIDARRFSGLQVSFKGLQFDHASIRLGNFVADILDGQVINNGYGIKAASATVKNGKGADIKIKGLNLGSFQTNDVFSEFKADDVSWQNALLYMPLNTGPKNQHTGKNTPLIRLSNINGKNSALVISGNEKRIATTINNLGIDELLTGGPAGQKSTVVNMHADGNNFEYDAPGTRVFISSYDLSDQQNSFLQGTSLENIRHGDTMNAQIPELHVTPNLAELLDGILSSDELILNRPQIKMRLGQKENVSGIITTNTKKITPVNIEILKMIAPDIDVIFWNPGAAVVLRSTGEENNITLNNIKMVNGPAETVHIENIALHLHNANLQGSVRRKAVMKQGTIQLQLDDISFEKNAEGKWDWSGGLNNLQVTNITGQTKKSGTFVIHSAGLEGLSLRSGKKPDILQMLKENKALDIKKFSGYFQDSMHFFSWHNAGFTNDGYKFSADSFQYHPVLSKEAYVAAIPYQTDYITLKTGKISATGIDFGRKDEDSVLIAKNIIIEDALFTDYRDKRIPRKPNETKALPATLLKRVPIHLDINKLQIKNAGIMYEEVHPTTGDKGIVHLNNINGNISHIKNRNLEQSDSLYVNASGLIENRIGVHLQLKESYIDSLQGFLTTIQLGPSSLSVLNPIIEPLTPVSLHTGYLDTLMIRANGNDSFAFGEVIMKYRDLKVKLSPQKKKTAGISSFVANLLIKNNGHGKTRHVFAERLKGRSLINYLIKITFSGLASSTGIKTHGKKIRAHKKEISKRPLPSFEPLR